MTSMQALAVAAAAFVAAGQPWPPGTEARIASLTAQTEAFTHAVFAETGALIHGCETQRNRAQLRRLPDRSIHLASRAARL